MVTSYLAGTRTTADWISDLAPENWRQFIALEYPVGDVSLTALTTLMRSESTDDYRYHWWNEDLPDEGGTVSSIYINSTLSSPYVYASHQATYGIAGAVVWAKVAEAVAKMFVVDDQVVLRDEDQFTVDVNGVVVSTLLAGANSYVAVKLLEADDNHDSSSSYNLATVDRITNLGAIGSESGASPQSVTYDPTAFENYAGTIRTPYEVSGVAMETRLRAGKSLDDEQRRATLRHGLAIERRLLFSVKSDHTGANGKPAPTTQGLIPAIRANASSNVSNYTTASAFNGQDWTVGGADWMKTYFEQIFRYGDDTKMAFCGSGCLLGIDKLAETFGSVNLRPRQTVFGLAVHEWVTPFGTIMIRNHPLLTKDPTTRNMMVLFEPDKLKYRYVRNRDTKLREDIGSKEIDGRKDEYLTQCGLEYHGMNGFGILDGFNQDNPAT